MVGVGRPEPLSRRTRHNREMTVSVNFGLPHQRTSATWAAQARYSPQIRWVGRVLPRSTQSAYCWRLRRNACYPNLDMSLCTFADDVSHESAYGNLRSFSGGVPSCCMPSVKPARPDQFVAVPSRSTSTTSGAGRPMRRRTDALTAMAIPFGPPPRTSSGYWIPRVVRHRQTPIRTRLQRACGNVRVPRRIAVLMCCFIVFMCLTLIDHLPAAVHDIRSQDCQATSMAATRR